MINFNFNKFIFTIGMQSVPILPKRSLDDIRQRQYVVSSDDTVGDDVLLLVGLGIIQFLQVLGLCLLADDTVAYLYIVIC